MMQDAVFIPWWVTGIHLFLRAGIKRLPLHADADLLKRHPCVYQQPVQFTNGKGKTINKSFPST